MSRLDSTMATVPPRPRHAHRHADQHQDDEDPEQDGGDHAWLRRMRRITPSMRSEMAAAITGSQIEYHHGRHADGGRGLFVDVFVGHQLDRQHRQQHEEQQHAAVGDQGHDALAPGRAVVGQDLDADVVVAHEAMLPPVMVSTISRKTEISSVQAKDWSVK